MGWGTPVKVSDCGTNAEQREHKLAVDADGNVYAVWLDERGRDQYTGDVYFSRWISGTAWGTWETSVQLSDSSMDYAESPDIVAGAGGLLLATWMERVPTSPATYDFQIVVARSEDDGVTWSRSIVHRLYGASASNAYYDNPSVGVDSAGRVYVTWLHSPDQQAATANILFSVSPDRGDHWTTPHILSRPQNTVSGSAAPDLVCDFEGKVVVAWEDYRGASAPQIYATGYPADHYSTSGEYARTFDAGAAAWSTVSWTATVPPGTGLALATRVVTTSGGGWTDWFTHAASGEAIPYSSGRSIQYRAVFTSAGIGTPVLDQVAILYERWRVFLPVLLK